MSFRNGDKARAGRLRKKRDHMRMKMRELRASLTAPAVPEAGQAATGAHSDDSAVKSAAVKIGSTLGKIVAATHLTGSEA